MFYDLALGEFDVQRPPRPSPVRSSYVLCSNPRSGSTLLSEALHALGTLGTPIEYFDGDDTMLACAQRWGCADVACYVQCLHRYRTTPDGVLGVKLHWYQLQELAFARYTPPQPGAHGRERAALASVFPSCRFVQCVRSDRLAQAVSWMVAAATGHWTTLKGRGKPPEVSYDFAAIDDCRRRIESAERSWSQLFAAAGIEPLTITYEQLAEEYQQTVARVAQFVGGDVTAADVPAPRLRKQSTDHSQRLLQRYTAELAARRDESDKNPFGLD